MKTFKSLSDLYDGIILNENTKFELASKSDLTNPSKGEVGSLDDGQDLFGSTPKPVEGPDKAKIKELKHKVVTGSSSAPKKQNSGFKGTKPAEDPESEESEEVEGEEVIPKSIKKENFNMSAFENLFKKTLNEEAGEELADETSDSSEGMDSEEDMDVSADDVDTEQESEEEEEGDLLSDLKDLHERLADIITKLEGGAEENEEEGEEGEYTDEDFDGEFGEEEGEEESFKESVDGLKPLSPSKGKTLMKKNNKVGKLKASGGKAKSGNLKSEPKPKPLGDKKGQLQKHSNQVKSTVKKGEFFK